MLLFPSKGLHGMVFGLTCHARWKLPCFKTWRKCLSIQAVPQWLLWWVAERNSPNITECAQAEMRCPHFRNAIEGHKGLLPLLPVQYPSPHLLSVPTIFIYGITLSLSVDESPEVGMWSFKIPHHHGHSDWSVNLHVTQGWPMISLPGTLSGGVANWERCQPGPKNAHLCHYIPYKEWSFK